MFNFFVFFYSSTLSHALNAWIYVEFVVLSWYHQYLHEP